MSTNLTQTAAYVRDTHLELCERIKFDMQSMDEVTKKMVMVYRGVLRSALSWTANCEQHKDASGKRNMLQAAFRLAGAKSMLDTYYEETKQELPASLKQEYGDAQGLIEAAEAEVINVLA